MVITAQEYGASIRKRSNCFEIHTTNGTHEICAELVSELIIYPSINISAAANQKKWKIESDI